MTPFRAVEKQHGLFAEGDAGDVSLPLMEVVDAASGCTPLMYAAMENKISLMERMKALGSPIDVTNKARGLLLY